jgi:hypothetical protein
MNNDSANIGNPYDSIGPSWACYADEGSAMVGMNEHEEEEFFLAFGTRKHRKAIKERRKAREEAQKRRRCAADRASRLGASQKWNGQKSTRRSAARDHDGRSALGCWFGVRCGTGRGDDPDRPGTPSNCRTET